MKRACGVTVALCLAVTARFARGAAPAVAASCVECHLGAGAYDYTVASPAPFAAPQGKPRVSPIGFFAGDQNRGPGARHSGRRVRAARPT